MEEHPEESASFQESALEKVIEKPPVDDSSSSDLNYQKSKKPVPSSISSLVKRVFRHGKLVHTLFGRGKSRDGILQRNKQTLAGFLASGTIVWFLFEWLGYCVLEHIFHALILGITILFVWLKVSTFIDKLFHVSGFFLWLAVGLISLLSILF